VHSPRRQAEPAASLHEGPAQDQGQHDVGSEAGQADRAEVRVVTADQAWVCSAGPRPVRPHVSSLSCATAKHVLLFPLSDARVSLGQADE